jgi:hypothetical protein
MTIDPNKVAQAIRKADGNHQMGASLLASAAISAYEQALEDENKVVVDKAEVEQLIGQFCLSYGSPDDYEYAALRWRKRLGLVDES